MENGLNRKQRTLMGELIDGRELAKQLRVQLCTTSSAEASEAIVQKILSSYEKALLILKWDGSAGQAQAQPVLALQGAPESPISINGSPRSEDADGIFKDNQDQQNSSKKRKTLPRWTDKVRVSFESGIEGPHEDGYSWRKYGQKDILGAKYPRSYYRCTYRNTQNCWAVKQVQRSDEDPTIFEVTYRGTHTCLHGNNQLVPPPASPEKQEQRHHHNTNDHDQPQSQILLNLRKSGLSIKNDSGFDNITEMAYPFAFPSTSSFGCVNSDNHYFSPPMLDENNFLGGFSSSFASSAAPESNYFLISPNQMNNFGGVHNVHPAESDLSELLSANNSAANSPILNLDFSFDAAEIDPNFHFGTSEFSF